MKIQELEPLEPELRDLLEGMRRLDAEDAAYAGTSTRLLARVEGAIRTSETSRRHATRARLGSLTRIVPVLMIAAGVTGMAARSAPTDVAPVSSPRPASVTTASATAAAIAAPLPAVHVDDLPSTSLAPATPAAQTVPRERAAVPARETHPVAGLAEEMRIVDAAAAAMRSKDPTTVLRLVREHERRFRTGELAQERERLFIQALVETGRLDEARQRVRTFRTQFPSGLLLPSVERSLEDASTP